MDAPLPELKKAHRELMSRYVAVLEEVRQAGWFMPKKETKPQDITSPQRVPAWLGRPLVWLIRPKSFAVRSLVHLFVEGHIKKKLKELSEGYLALRAQAPADDKDLREWAKDCGDVCDKMAATLATWASIEGVLRLLWPFAIGGLTAWLGVKDIWEVFRKLDAKTFALTAAFLFLPALYLLTFMSASFGYRRQMFIPSFDADERPLDSKTGWPEYNIYLLEDRLFNLLNRTKSREKPWDLHFAIIAMCLFGSMPLLVLLVGQKPPVALWLCSAFFWILVIIGLVTRKPRVWR